MNFDQLYRCFDTANKALSGGEGVLGVEPVRAETYHSQKG
jgi:hypothetical protein